MEHLFSRIQVKTKKKRSSSKIEDFYPQIYAQMYTHSNYWGDAVVDHSQTIGENTAKLLGEIYPPIPSCFGTPARNAYFCQSDRYKLDEKEFMLASLEFMLYGRFSYSSLFCFFCSKLNKIILKKICFKLHLHGRVLAARIDILPFCFLKSHWSSTRRKIYVRFNLRNIAKHAPQKIKSQQLRCV